MNNATALELQVRGEQDAQFLQHALRRDEVLRVGRVPKEGFTIPWDPTISREHFDICWSGDTLRVICQESARNPILFRIVQEITSATSHVGVGNRCVVQVG
jgi:hypothetical protein